MKQSLICTLLALLAFTSNSKAQLIYETQFERNTIEDHSWDIHDIVELPNKQSVLYAGGVVNPTIDNYGKFSGIYFVDKYGDPVYNAGGAVGLELPFSPGTWWKHQFAGLMAKDLILTPNGEYLLYGLSFNAEEKRSEFRVVSMDMAGNVSMAKKMPTKPNLQSIESGSANSLHIYQLSLDEVSTGIRVSDGYVFAGRSRYTHNSTTNINIPQFLSLLKLDLNGNFMWYKEYSDIEFPEVTKVREGMDGNILLSYMVLDGLYNVTSGAFMKIDQSSGEPIWRLNNVMAKDFVETNFNSFITVGFQTKDVGNTPVTDGIINKFTVNENGECPDLGASLEQTRLKDFRLNAVELVPAPGEGYAMVIAGQKNQTPVAIQMLSDLQTVLSTRTYTDLVNEEAQVPFLDVVLSDDGGFYFGGYGDIISAYVDNGILGTLGGSSHPYIAKTNSTFETKCEETVVILFDEYEKELNFSCDDQTVTEQFTMVSYEPTVTPMHFWGADACCKDVVTMSGNTQICASGGNTTLTANYIPQTGDLIYWTDGSSPISTSYGQPTINVSNPGDYYFIVEHSNGCITQGHLKVTHFPPLQLLTGILTQLRCLHDSPIYLTLPNEPQPGNWSGTGVTGNYPNFFFDPNLAGTGAHPLTVTYTDQYGCFQSLTVTMKVGAGPPEQVVAPNIQQTSFCTSASGPFTLPGPGYWKELSTGLEFSEIIPTQWCTGCTSVFQYCEYFESPYGACEYCDPNTVTFSFHNNCSGDRLYVDKGVEDEAVETQFTLFPNPADQSLTFGYALTDANHFISLITLQGKVLHTIQGVTGNGQTTFDTSSLSAGIYFVALSNGDSVISRQRIVVTH